MTSPRGGFASQGGFCEGHRCYTFDWSTKKYAAIPIPHGCRAYELKQHSVACNLQMDPAGTAIGTTEASMVAAEKIALAETEDWLPRECHPGQVLRLQSASNLGTVDLILYGVVSQGAGDQLPTAAVLAATIVTENAA